MMDYESILEICKRHAARLAWAHQSLNDKFPLTPDKLAGFPDELIEKLHFKNHEKQNPSAALPTYPKWHFSRRPKTDKKFVIKKRKLNLQYQ